MAVLNLRHNVNVSALLTCPICGAARDESQAHAIPEWFFFKCGASYTYEGFIAHTENHYQLYHPCGRMLETIESLRGQLEQYQFQAGVR